MKSKRLLYLSLVAIPAFGFITSSSLEGSSGNCNPQSAQGQASSTGSPGEMGTCSRSTCHGAGNGNNSSGGLADNAGPGSMVLTSVPAMTGNTYVPNTTYHMSVTVSETGKPLFGFAIEMLDNSGSINTHINNTAGSLVVTNTVTTRTWQAFGTGRLALTHNTNGGLMNNTSTFNFDWVAPATGTVNCYLCGNAANHNGFSDAPDNVYSQHIILTPNNTGISQNQVTPFSITLFPNPALEQITLSFFVPSEQLITVQLFSPEGKLIKNFEAIQTVSGLNHQNLGLQGIAKGLYEMKIISSDIHQSRKLLIE